MNYSYTYPSKIKNNPEEIHHIVDNNNPVEFKQTYYSSKNLDRPTDSFYFKPPKDYKYKKQECNTYIIPGIDEDEKVREIHTTFYTPQKCNENGVIREKRNYLLYENKNWTENIGHPFVEYETEKIPKPKPKPKMEPKIETETEIINEEIETEENIKKRNLKSNYIRKSDKIKNKKYKFKKINKSNYIRKKDMSYENEDNIVKIYDVHNSTDNNDYNKENDNEDKGSEIKKIKKMTEQKK